VSSRRSAPSARATTWASSAKGAPVIRCFTREHPPVAVRARRGLEGQRVGAGAGLGQREGHVGAPGQEVVQVALARLAAPVRGQRAGPVGPGQHPLGAPQPVSVDLLLDVEAVDQASPRPSGGARWGGRAGLAEACCIRRLRPWTSPARRPSGSRAKAVPDASARARRPSAAPRRRGSPAPARGPPGPRPRRVPDGRVRRLQEWPPGLRGRRVMAPTLAANPARWLGGDPDRALDGRPMSEPAAPRPLTRRRSAPIPWGGTRRRSPCGRPSGGARWSRRFAVLPPEARRAPCRGDRAGRG